MIESYGNFLISNNTKILYFMLNYYVTLNRKETFNK